MWRIEIENTSFTREDLQRPDRGAWSGFSENSAAALGFCSEWLSGKNSFTLHTSGSTGAPRPVVLTRGQISSSVRMTAKALGLHDGMKILVCLPVRYIAGMMMLARAMELEMNARVLEPAGDALAEIGAEEHFDLVSLVPAQLSGILAGKAGMQKLDNFRYVLLGGAPIGPSLERELAGLKAAFYHTYGMTETASHIALRALNGPNASPYFKPLEGIELGLDERGCLLISGAVTGGRLLRTNDLAEVDDKGFRILGRVDNIINSGGVKIQPEKVERAIAETYPGSPAFFVAALPDEKLGEKLVAVFEGRLEAALLQGLKEKLQLALNRLELPREFLTMDRFVYTATGKIDKVASMHLLKKGGRA